MTPFNHRRVAFRRWLLAPILEALTGIAAQLTQLETHMAQIDDDIAALQADVAADTTAVNSAVTLINGLAKQLADAIAAAQAAGATPAELQALTDLHTAMTANTQSLSAAVAANTPAAPTP